MDVYLASVPLPSFLKPGRALGVSLALLAEDAPSPTAVALSLCLLSQSWTHGRMLLADHLECMRRTEGDKGLRAFVAPGAVSPSRQGLGLAQSALVARETAARWLTVLQNEGCDLVTVLHLAVERFDARLRVRPAAPENAATLNRLLRCLSPYESDGSERLENSLTRLAQPAAAATPAASGASAAAGATLSRALFDDNLLRQGTGRDLSRDFGQHGVGAVLARWAPKPAQPFAPAPAPAATPAAQPAMEGPRALLWTRETAAAALAHSQGGPFDGIGKHLALLRTMADADGWRQLKQVPAASAGTSVLDSLYKRFPHFGGVLDFIGNALALAGCGSEGALVRIPPLLLRGEPGTGKTFFAQELARVLDLHFVERDLAVMTEAFVITGNDAAWKGAKPGVVFDTLVHGQTANPLVLLNEVDKASATDSRNSPLAPMYALLEQTSAARFVDEFATVAIDASHINWVLTANDGHIPAPVLSRLEVFDIRQPNRDERRAIASSVWSSLLDKTLPAGHGFPGTLPDDVAEHMAAVSPRVMRKALTHAAGAAVAAGRRALTLDDLNKGAARYAETPARAIGFVH